MSDLQSVTLRVPSEVLSEIDVVAGATDRSRSYIVVRALRTYLLNEGSNILAAAKGRDQIAAGDYDDLDDVIAEMDRIVEGD